MVSTTPIHFALYCHRLIGSLISYNIPASTQSSVTIFFCEANFLANRDVGKEVAADMKDAYELKGSIAKLECERHRADKMQRKNEKSVEELSAKIEELTSRLTALSAFSSPSPLVRKRSMSEAEQSEQ
jgi:hypothetical protein